jgi:predicted nucleic acid-binding protein
VSLSSLESALPVGDRLLLDTTVIASYLDATDATHPVAEYILEVLIASGRNPAVVSMISVMELLVRPFRASPPGHHTVLAFLRSYPNLDTVPIDLQIAQDAAFLRADKRFSPPDALVVATGLATQVRHLVTNDHDWSTKLASMSTRIDVIRTSSYLPFP